MRTLLVSGGAVTFNCNGNNSPATIIVNPAIVLGNGTFSLDGGGKITLSGANTNRIFIVNPSDIFASPSFTLSHIVLTNGYAEQATGSHGGCLYIGFANQVLLDDVTVQNCHIENGGLGGGIRNGLGNLNVINSRILTNSAGSGGGISSASALTITNTLVAANRAITGTGGGLDVYGQTLITSSTIYSNSAALDGGGVHGGSIANVSVTNSQINDNAAVDGGGGLFSQWMLTVRQTTLEGNRSDTGAGISNDGGTLLLLTSKLNGNNSDSVGGGIHNNLGTASLSDVTLNANSGDFGGGLYNSYSTATLTNVTLSGNTAILGGGLFNANGAVELTNATLSGNSAAFGGGIVNSSGAATLTNVRLSGNYATGNGGGLYQNATLATHPLTLRNSIVANSPSGGNCYSTPASAIPPTSNNFNLSDDTSCTPYFNKAGDLNGPDRDPNLGPLTNNGGPTLTHVPFPPSPAIDAGQCANGSLDQRGITRPVGAACDIGAVEYHPGDTMPRLHLPLIRR